MAEHLPFAASSDTSDLLRSACSFDLRLYLYCETATSDV